MIEHVYQRAAAAPQVDQVIVATDDERIAAVVSAFGGRVCMTQPSHRSGSDRIAEVVTAIPCDIVVNVQGDLPLLEPAMIGQIVEPFDGDPALPMATLARPLTDAADFANPNVVKVVLNRHGDALYFSRAAIPFPRGTSPNPPCFKHFGLYAYRRDFLLTLTTLAPTPLEIAESLEQLRALEHGYRIRVVETRYDSIEVDTPEDLERARQSLTAGART